MHSLQPAFLLVGCTLLGVAVGALIGAELHLDVSVPTHVAHLSSAEASPLVAVAPAPRPAPRHESRARVEKPRTSVVTLDAELAELVEGTSEPLGRALLHRGTDGELDGYRISAIRKGSLAERLGLENGDIVHAVDGRPLTSMDEASEVLADLRHARSFTVDLSRRGHPVSQLYRVR